MQHPANGSSSLVVDPASGPNQTQTQQGSDNTMQVEKLVFSAGRVEAGEISITSSIIDADFDLSASPQPIVILSAGQSWSWNAVSTDGKEKLALSGSFAGTGSLAVGGKLEQTDTIATTLTLTGSINATIMTTDDYDPAYRLILRDHAITKATYDGVPVAADTTTTLGSLTPS